MANSEEFQIARGLRERDMEMVRVLVGRYQYRLLRYLIYLLGRRDTAEDLAQETWVRVLERGHTYNPAARFEPWLFSIARNLAVDLLRKHRMVSLDSNENSTEEAAPMVPVSSAPSPFEQAARTEDAARLAQALQSLEPAYREALLLRFQEDLSFEEMAAVTGAAVSTVSSRVYRGLTALRAHWKGDTHAG